MKLIPEWLCLLITKGKHSMRMQEKTLYICDLCDKRQRDEEPEPNKPTPSDPSNDDAEDSTPPTTDTSNIRTSQPYHPDFEKGVFPAEWNVGSGRVYNNPPLKSAKYYGSVFCGNKENATNFRYGLRAYFERKLGVPTGYNEKDKGFVCIDAGGDTGTCKWWVIGYPSPAFSGSPLPKTPTPKPEPEGDDSDNHPAAMHGPIFNHDGCLMLQLGKGGLRWNASTSKGKGKLIFPSKYTGQIVHISFWTPSGGGKVSLKPVHPHESGNRERVYYPQGIAETPTKLLVRAHRVVMEGGIATTKDLGVIIENTQVSLGEPLLGEGND